MPDAHHVQMRVRQIEKAAAVAGVPQLHGNFPLFQRVQHFVEARELEIGKGLVRFVRLREMRHHAFEQQRFFRDNFFDERQRLVPAHAVTAHAGVDFDVNRNPLAELRRDFRQRADGVRLVHANGQVMRHAPFEFGLLPFAQQQQRRGDAAFAQMPSPLRACSSRSPTRLPRRRCAPRPARRGRKPRPSRRPAVSPARGRSRRMSCRLRRSLPRSISVHAGRSGKFSESISSN